MRIRVLGGGWYGCHLALALIEAGHDVRLYEEAATLFSGASGNMPGRLHLGFHYPRSLATRDACRAHYARFMARYGHLTRGVPTNIYAIARDHSLVDFGNYVQSLKGDVDFVKIESPGEFGLANVEGALLTGERHTLIGAAREWFTKLLGDAVIHDPSQRDSDHLEYDLTVDCTFCARDGQGVDRYEPCVTGILSGPTNVAVTIMDGPFPSLYPWDEVNGLNSITSAKFTPLTKECTTYGEARAILDETSDRTLRERCMEMVEQIRHYYPRVRDYNFVGCKKAIRAMPLSGSDTRLVDVVRSDPKTIRIRASKLDAIFYAEDVVKEAIRVI